MCNYELTYQPYGEKGILISWPQYIEEDILKDIVSVKSIIISAEDDKLLDVTNGYNSLLLLYKEDLNTEKKTDFLRGVITSRKHTNQIFKNQTWVIPVCYHESFAMDLAEMAAKKNQAKEQLVALHTTPDYRVYCKGFLPGFMYLGGLDPKLHMPRKTKPRLKVPKNSVAIGGEQTGIYPSESPGGWHIIGRTPVALFDVSDEQVSPINLGDTIRFKEVSLEEYIAMEFKNVKITPQFE